jgi:mRNA-degrading endonuclease toxin of MazEF toxin-antitoxin module
LVFQTWTEQTTVKTLNEPRAASVWRPLAEGLRRVLVRLRPSTNAAGAVQEYVRVVPVLAGQVRQVASQIEDSRQTQQLLLDQTVKNAQLAMAAVERMDRLALGLQILAFNAKIESSEGADELSRHADHAAALAEDVRATLLDFEASLELARNDLRQLAEADRVDERLQHVVATLSEMQGDFVAALERPEERSAFSGAAALRLRQRYTASSS